VGPDVREIIQSASKFDPRKPAARNERICGGEGCLLFQLSSSIRRSSRGLSLVGMAKCAATRGSISA
jgi:hypothetical protein